MPYQPDVRDVHVDTALTNMSIAYMQNADDFIADIVFPPVSVNHKSDKYFVWAKDVFMRRGGRITPFGEEAPRGGFTMSTDAYSVDTWRWAFDLLPDVVANADSPIMMDQAASAFVMNGLLVEREINWGTNFFTSGVWGTDLDGSGGTPDFVPWDDPTNSDPIADVANARGQIKVDTGYLPNTMVVGFRVHEALKRHPLILERVKYTSAASITAEIIARYFEIDRYIVAQSVQATNQEGQAITTDFILGDNVLICYSAPAPSLMAHSAGYTFIWNGLTRMNNLGIATVRYPMPHLGTTPAGTVERIEGMYSYSMKKTGADLGYFLGNAVGAGAGLRRAA